MRTPYSRGVTGATPGVDEVRLAEVIASMSLATDLGMGLPLEHGLRSTLVAMRLADRIGVGPETAEQTYYGCLLFYVGCTADAEQAAALFPDGQMLAHFNPVVFGSPPQILRGIARAVTDPGSSRSRRVAQVAVRLPKATRGHAAHTRAMCEVATMLCRRLGLPAAICEMAGLFTERWDGKGQPQHRGGADLPLALRVIHVARDATFQCQLGGPEYAATVVRERGGGALDPDVATLLADAADEVLSLPAGGSVWADTLSHEPGLTRLLHGPGVDDALAAMGDFADLVSPRLTGHAAAVADLAARAARECGCPEPDQALARRAGCVLDIGRVAVTSRIWDTPEQLTPDDWEKMRLHPYHSERVLSPSSFLARLAPLAAAHHERMDGSGYHRGAKAPALPLLARLLAVADLYRTKTEPRPHRRALTPDQAAAELRAEAAAGRLDGGCVAAVLAAAGQPAAHVPRPAGLTERETVVIALLARGLQNKEIAKALVISPKTADRHVQNAYIKIGVSTRAAAALYAMEHGLTVWGELPMVAGAARP